MRRNQEMIVDMNKSWEEKLAEANAREKAEAER